MTALVNITGQRFGRLTAIRRVPGEGRAQWLFRCDCGAEKTIVGQQVRDGRTQSCGCLFRERAATRSRALLTQHGQSVRGAETSEYKSWTSMKKRCYQPGNASFKGYGARGITVCDRWRESFEAFFEDMGPKPTTKHTIDRIDPAGNYEPSNCRWATPTEQVANRRRFRPANALLQSDQVLEIHGAAEGAWRLSKRLGIPINVIKQIRAGKTYRDITGGVRSAKGN